DLDDLAAIEDVPPKRGVCCQRSEAVIRDQAQQTALAQPLDSIRKEHRVGVGIAGPDTASPSVGLTLAVEPGIDALLVLRLPRTVRRIADDRIKLDLINRTNFVDGGVDSDDSLRVREQLTLPLRRVQ